MGAANSTINYCINEDNGQPWPPNMDLVEWQRWWLLAGCILSALSGVYVCVSYWRNPSLRRRPGSLLYYRTLCNLGFALVIIVNEILYAARRDFPTEECLTNPVLGADCVAGGATGCRTTAFFVQWFLLAGESYYFAITLDLLANLFLSPFGSQSFRQTVYHCATVGVSTVLATGLVLSGDAEDGSWGPSCVVLRHVCWLKRFGVPGVSTSAMGGWVFYYIPTTLYYVSGIVAWLVGRRSLSKGLPRTFKVRERQLEAGRKLVTTLSTFLILLAIFSGILVALVKHDDKDQESNNITKWMRVIFAFWIGSSGLWNFVVWVTVVVPLARLYGGENAVRPCWESWNTRSAGRGDSTSRAAISRRRSSAAQMLHETLVDQTDQSTTLADPIAAATENLVSLSVPELSKRAADAGATQDSIEEARDAERPKAAMIALIASAKATTAPVPDGEELNLALQEEVLYFTLLGLRAAAAGEHLWWKNNSHGDAGVDLVSAIRSGLSITPPGSFSQEAGATPTESAGIGAATTEEEVEKMRGALDRMKFSFTSYSHEVMQELRDDVFGVNGISYATSLRGHKDAHFDGGKSGAIFFFSADQKYIIKEVTDSERKALVKLLPGYLDHMRANCQTSMLPRIVQCCSIYMYRKTLNFMVMENIFYAGDYGAVPPVVKPNAVYDIKGSWVDRNASGTRSHKLESGTFKDNDLTDVLYLPSLYRKELIQALERDTNFLAMHNIMDYSLLLGMLEHRSFLHPQDRPLPPSGSTGVDGDATPFFRVDHGGMEAAVIEGPGAYHMGLVDILQVWDWSKELERFTKVRLLRKDGDGLSAIEPKKYQKRFMKNLEFITMDVAEVVGVRQSGVVASTSGRTTFSENSFGSATEGSLPVIRAGGSMDEQQGLLASSVDRIDDSVEAAPGAE